MNPIILGDSTILIQAMVKKTNSKIVALSKITKRINQHLINLG